jgi:hypothetical protein
MADNPYAQYAAPQADNPYASFAEPAQAANPYATAQPDTSIAQNVGVQSRAALPYATAAGMGAAMGAPLGGIGAIPGAIAGMGALGLADLGTGVYNLAATPFGAKPIPSGSEAIRNMFGYGGMAGRAPQTPEQAVAAATTEGALSGLSGAGAARTIGANVLSPTAKKIANWFAEKPITQMFSGAGASAVPTVQREYFDETDPYALATGSLFGGVLTGKFGPGMLEKGVKLGESAKRLITGANVSRDALRADVDTAFKAATASGVQYQPTAFNGLITDVQDALKNSKYDPRSSAQAPVTEAVETLRRYAGQPNTLDQLHLMRRDLSNLYSSGNSDANRLIRGIVDKVDEFITTPTNATVGGNFAEGSKALMDGISGYSRLMKGEDILGLVDSAARKPGNFANALRREFDRLANSSTRMRYFTPDEQEAIRAAAKGGTTDSALNLISQLAPRGSWGGTIARATIPTGMLGYGAATGDPTVAGIGAGLAATGAGAAGMRNLLASARARDLAASMRRGDVQAPSNAFLTGIAGRTVPQSIMYSNNLDFQQ